MYFDPADLCVHNATVLLTPLPAKKSLWQASHEASWKADIGSATGDPVVFALAANGDLVRCDSSQSRVVDGRAATSDWPEWCAEMDEMGVLVMLAASLVS